MIHHGTFLGIQSVGHASKASKQGTVHGIRSDEPFRSALARERGWGLGDVSDCNQGHFEDPE